MIFKIMLMTRMLALMKVHFLFCMVNDAYECANVRIFALMNVSSHYWSPFHANDCVFSRNEQQKV